MTLRLYVAFQRLSELLLPGPMGQCLIWDVLHAGTLKHRGWAAWHGQQPWTLLSIAWVSHAAALL